MSDQQTGSIDIELSKPLDIDGAKVNVLTMREPTVADQMNNDSVKGGDAIKEVTMLANLCQITPDQLKSLTLRDYKKVQAAFMGFIE
jgi:hypothetical protein